MKEKGMVWGGALCCLAFLLPNHYSPWLSFHQELGVALALLPLFLRASLQGRSMSALTLGAALLSMMPLLQLISGQLYFAGDGWMSALYLLGLGWAVHAGWFSVERASNIESAPLICFTSFWCGLVMAGLFSVGIAAHQWLLLGKLSVFIADMPPGGRPFANLAQPNQLATLLLLATAGLMFLWESGKLTAFSTVAAVLVLIFGLVMTGSRSVLLTLAWLVPAYFLLRRRCQLRTTPGAFSLVVGVFLTTGLLWPWINNTLLLPSDITTAVDRMSMPDIRKVYWTSMLDAIGRAPWAGYGWGQIGVAQTATALDYPATHSFFDSSHNLLLDLALWNGLPVALLVALGLLLWFGWQIRQCADPLTWVTLVAIGMVFSHAMVEYPLNYAYFLLPVGLWMGALSAMHPLPLERYLARGARWWRIGVPPTGAAVLILFVTVVVEYLPYEEDWRLMRFQELHIGDLTPPEGPPVYLLTQLHEFMRFARKPQTPGMTSQDLEGMRKISERYAYPSSMYRYALAQALNNDPHGAQQTLERLCKMQSVAACIDARRQWDVDAIRHYPQLSTAPFP
ncbi:PglL family O-oligosaccharyltransferase [Acidovorax soli]|nr:O-antigen ligase family protein [Acidovorax soli]